MQTKVTMRQSSRIKSKMATDSTNGLTRTTRTTTRKSSLPVVQRKRCKRVPRVQQRRAPNASREHAPVRKSRANARACDFCYENHRKVHKRKDWKADMNSVLGPTANDQARCCLAAFARKTVRRVNSLGEAGLKQGLREDVEVNVMGQVWFRHPQGRCGRKRKR